MRLQSGEFSELFLESAACEGIGGIGDGAAPVALYNAGGVVSVLPDDVSHQVGEQKNPLKLAERDGDHVGLQTGVDAPQEYIERAGAGASSREEKCEVVSFHSANSQCELPTACTEDISGDEASTVGQMFVAHVAHCWFERQGSDRIEWVRAELALNSGVSPERTRMRMLHEGL